MTIGQRIKELRKELKISQKELGTLLTWNLPRSASVLCLLDGISYLMISTNLI